MAVTENPIPRNLFENIVATMPQPISIWDSNLQSIYSNPAWQRSLVPLFEELEAAEGTGGDTQLLGDLQTAFALAGPVSGSFGFQKLGFDSDANYTVKLVDSQHCMVVVNTPLPARASEVRTAARHYAINDEHYRLVFESIDEGFCIIEVLFDEQGNADDYRFLDTNPAFSRHTGLVDSTGKTVREIMPGVEPSWFKAYGRVAKTGKAERVVEHFSARDRWFEVDAFRLAEKAKVALLLRDVTERKRAEDELLRVLGLLEGIARGSEDLIAALDRDFRFLYCNDAYRREFQRLWRFDVAEGSSLLEALAPWPKEQRKLQSLWSRALDGESFRVQADFGPNESDRRIYDLRFNPIRDPHGRAVGAAHIFRDITEQVRVQDELRASEERLRESDRRKDEYLAMLGHELRNPLAAVRNATELIKRSAFADERLQHASAVLERQTHHMARLLDGLLEVSRIAQGKIGLAKEMIDLRNVLRGVLQDRGSHLENRHISLTESWPDEPVWVRGDPVRLAQVFDNLMGNAIKFCKMNDVIDVSLKRDGDTIEIAIRDSGVGIPLDLITRIFEPFFQGQQDIARATGGLGLGLALVKGLTELHGGRVAASSEGMGRGACFTVTLPASEAPEPSTNEELPPLKPSRILIVEDNADAGQTLCELLGIHGHQAQLVQGGVQALNFLWKNGSDLVLCDLGLPDMSGYDLARAIRGDEALQDIPLIALTGYGQPNDRRRSSAAGFDDHLTKPVDLQVLMKALRRLLHSRVET